MLMKQKLETLPGIAWHWTSCSPAQEPVFRGLLDQLKPQTVLEIGTHQGVSAALLAEYAGLVITVDVLPNPARAKVWDLRGVADRIEEHVHKSQAGRDGEITRAAALADLAFIDGSHLMRDIEYDFGLVVGAGCKRIILHDYWQNAEDWPDVKEFVDTIESREGAKCDVFGPCYAQTLKTYTKQIHKPFVLVEVL